MLCHLASHERCHVGVGSELWLVKPLRKSDSLMVVFVGCHLYMSTLKEILDNHVSEAAPELYENAIGCAATPAGIAAR